MAQTLEQLSKQAATLSSINSIVRTMKSLAAINAAPYEQAAAAIEGFQHSLEKGFAAFAYCTQGRYAQTAAPGARQLLIVFGSDHGLCGSYNEQLAEQALKFCQARPQAQIQLICVGARMARALQDRGLVIHQQLMPPAAIAGVNRLAGELVQRIERFNAGAAITASSVHLAFTLQTEHSQREPLISTLLPLPKHLFKAPSRWPSPALPGFSMDEAQLLASLVRHYIFARLYRATAAAMASENAARLALMQQAEQSVGERLAALRQEMMQARQDDITNELLDILMGHEHEET